MSKSSFIYQRCPTWLQEILTSVKGLEYRYLRSDDRLINGELGFLLQSQWWSHEQFLAYQIVKLQSILKNAFENVPYYRDLQTRLKCRPEDFRSLEDLRIIPVLEKHMLRENERSFISDKFHVNNLTHGFTSGTTGTPINLYETKESFSRRWAFVCRLRVWSGISNPFYPKRAQFTGKEIVPEKFSGNKFWRSNIPGNSVLFSTTHISPKNVPYYVKKLAQIKPDLIDGYPSALLAIARVSKRLNLQLPRPKAIIVTAETLFPEDRVELKQAFGCNVFNQYAASEPSCFWCDCEYEFMHINPEYGISEVVDKNGNPVLPGQEGEVVVTSFLNPAMPLIRYKIGDVAVLKEASTICKCGRCMPIVEKVTGRIDDVIYVPARGYVGRLDPVFKGLRNIVEAQIIQEDFETVEVLIVPDKFYTSDIGFELESNLHQKLGEQVKVKIRLTDRIPRGKNGKFRPVVSKVKHLYPDTFR